MKNIKNSFNKKVKATKDKTASNIKSNIDTAKKNVNNKVDVAKSKLENISLDAKKKYTQTVNQGFEMIPMLQEIGFETEEVLVHFAVPPAIEVRLQYHELPDEEDLKEYKEKYKKDKMFLKVVDALYTAGSFQSQFNTGVLKPSGIMLNMTIPPSVALVYLPKNVDASQAMLEEVEVTVG